MKFEIIRSPKQLASLHAEWNSLFERALSPRLGQSFAWISCVWETILEPQGARLHILLLREDNRLVLIWPLVIQRHKRLWRAVCPLMIGSDFNDMIVEASPTAPDLAARAVRELRRNRGHDLIYTDWVQKDSLLEGALSAVDPMYTGVVLSIRWDAFPDWATYERSVLSRQPISRRLRRLKEQGNVIFELVEDRDRRLDLTSWFVEQKLRRFATQQKTLLPDIALMVRFLPKVIDCLGERLLFFVLMFDAKPIAVQIAVRDKNRLTAFQIAHASEFDKYGPGILIFRHFIKYAFEQKLEVELGWGDAPYKQSFAKCKSEISRRLFPTSTWGNARMAMSRIWRRIRSWEAHITSRSRPSF